METSKKGIELLKNFEGFRSKPYKDSAGIPTIGYGNTYYCDGNRVAMWDKPISKEEAEKMLKCSLDKSEKAINQLVTSNINQNNFDALASFVYNIGVTAFKESTLRKVINENPKAHDEIKREFMRWVNAGGVKLKGLKNRRKKEYKLYIS